MVAAACTGGAEVLRVELDAREVARLGQQIARAPEVVREELRGFVETTLAHLQGEVQERTPTTQGTLRKSITSQVTELQGLGVEGRVGSPLGYATAVELGTKPHMPPVAPLELWAQAKLGVRGKEARQAAWAIARKIARVGTEGAFMFRDTFEANQDAIQAGLSRAVERIAQRIGDPQ
jgi:hypothetical protein